MLNTRIFIHYLEIAVVRSLSLCKIKHLQVFIKKQQLNSSRQYYRVEHRFSVQADDVQEKLFLVWNVQCCAFEVAGNND